MDTRKIIEGVVDAFDKNDTEGILQHIADDFEWHMLGEHVISGKETLRKFFADNPEVKVVKSTKDRFIVEGNQASVSGEVLCKNEKTGELYDMYYCDIYELSGGKVKKMVTFSVNKKK